MEDARGPKEFSKILDYALVGDCRASALVSRSGSVDWLCWPRFDSRAIFAAILDTENGGCWSVAPTRQFESLQKYVTESNVVQTEFECGSGRAVLTDFMPVATEEWREKSLMPDHEMIRLMECVSGEVEIEIRFRPKRDFGAKSVRLRKFGNLGIRLEADGRAYWLRSSHRLDVRDGEASSRVVLKTGEQVQMSLTFSEESPVVLSPLGGWSQQRLEMTTKWWQQWAGKTQYKGDYRDAVVRSALLLKLLTYSPSGAVIAAPTTSLPERIGDSLNWDYRFCWLRDSSLTVRALLGLGHIEESDAFLNWLLYATALTAPQLRVLYTIFGDQPGREKELDYLSGYRNSRPVRVGNGARDQLQLDVYGEVIDAAAQFAHAGGRFDRATQTRLKGFGDFVVKHWDQPDEGIWEPRNGRGNHTHSRLLCWTALDRLIKMAKHGRLSGIDVKEYKKQRHAIMRQIREQAWNKGMESYASELGGDSLDASLLLLSYYGFEHANSERMRKTYRRLRDGLGAGPLIYRYKRNPPEGAFGICSFWEVEYLALGGGTLDEARELFERLLQYASPTGLFAEEMDPTSGEALGNYPQAFTHVGLISAALSITERERGVRQLPHREHSAERNHEAAEMVA